MDIPLDLVFGDPSARGAHREVAYLFDVQNLAS